MAEGGYENSAFDLNDPSLDYRDNEDNDDDDDDDQDSNETTPFWPDSASTPGPSGEEIPMQTMQHEKNWQPEEEESYAELPSFEGFIHKDDKPAIVDRAKEFIKRKFPRVDFKKLGPIGFGKNLAIRIQLFPLAPGVVRLKSLRKMEVAFSKNSRIRMKTRLGLKLNL